MKKATLEDAIALAVKAHAGQIDKAGQPYILHPLRVMFTCQSEAARIVAVLHDVIEDTSVTVEDLKAMGFREVILDALACVTKREGESYDDFVARAAANPIAREVKLADLKDNMDLTRLQSVTPKDAQRIEKYLRAYQYLMGR